MHDSVSERIALLECTFRDGGQGLESSSAIGIPVKSFSRKSIHKGISDLSKTGIEIIEIGYIQRENVFEPFASYYDVESISANIPDDKGNAMYIALFTGPDTPAEIIPEHKEGLPDGLRVILRYSELKKSLDFCEMLCKKGYKTFVQPMLTMRYTDEELGYIIKRSNDMGAFALYIVDSFGYMTDWDTSRIFRLYDKGLRSGIKIGFHGHNNMNMAFFNACKFVELAMSESKRDIIVDSSALGMGQGAGNLQSELIIHYLNETYGKKYNLSQELELCEYIENLSGEAAWGYGLTYALPAMYKASYKYGMVMRKKYHMNYNDINKVFSIMPSDIKHRYTPENLSLALEMAGFKLHKE